MEGDAGRRQAVWPGIRVGLRLMVVGFHQQLIWHIDGLEAWSCGVGVEAFCFRHRMFARSRHRQPPSYFLRLHSLSRCRMDTYSAASRTKLLRMFDFTRFRKGNFPGWGDGRDERNLSEHSGVAVWLTVQPGVGSYSRGVQIIEPRMTVASVRAQIRVSMRKRIESMRVSLHTTGRTSG
jgi:hypothetical protein